MKATDCLCETRSNNIAIINASETFYYHIWVTNAGIYNQINNNCIEYAIAVLTSYTFYVDIQLFTYVSYNFVRIFINWLQCSVCLYVTLGSARESVSTFFANRRLFWFWRVRVWTRLPMYANCLTCFHVRVFFSLLHSLLFVHHFLHLSYGFCERAMSGERIFSHKLSHLRIINKLFTVLPL